MLHTAHPGETYPLPSLRTKLYGRDRESSSGISFLLDDAVPLLTITGPGGVGKTSLALQIARRLTSSFADGVIWFDFTPISDPAIVPMRLASALGISVPDGSVAAVTESLKAALQVRQCLLLLDNCEHVVTAVGELLDLILPFCPAVQVLATSRVPLNIRGEQRLRLDPLPVPRPEQSQVDELLGIASVQLFLDRARARQPRLQADAVNAPSIAALCRHLEGMPLAIELAATQINVFSPDALVTTVQAGSLSQPLSLNGLPDRQRSIAATIDWSYGLLSPDGQALFRRLSVFASGWTVEAAQAVVGWGSARGVEALNELVDANLISVSEHAPEARFDMLESMRTYALLRLREHGEEPSARQAHASHFTEYFARSYPDIVGTNALPWLQRFDLELDNIRSAFSWLLEQGDGLGAMRLLAATDDYWSYRKHRADSRTWAETALKLAPDAPAGLRSVVLHIATFSTRSLGDFPEAIALAEQGLAAARESGELIAIGRAYYQLGNAWHHVDLAHAVEATRQAVSTFRETNNACWLAVVLADLGDKLRDSGEVEAAIPVLDEGIALNREVGNPWGIAQALGQRAHASLTQRDFDRAATLFAESIPIARDISDEHMVMGAVVGLSGVALHRGFPIAAAVLLGAVDAEQRANGWPRVSHPIPAAKLRQSVIDALDEGSWAAAMAFGKSIPFADAVDAALTIAAGDEAVLHSLEQRVEMPAVRSLTASPTQSQFAVSAQDGADLSWRELEVLTLLCQRSTNTEMAQALFVSTRTIESHVSHILVKLQVRNRREAAAIAVKHGLVSLSRS